MTLTEKQYQLLLDLYHELPDAFNALPQIVLSAYYERLYRPVGLLRANTR